MSAFRSRSVVSVAVAALVLLGGQWTWAGNLPVWGGATTTDQPSVQQPSKPLASEPAVNTGPTIQPVQTRPWRSPGTTLTPATTKTPVQQLQTNPTETVVTGAKWAQWSELAWEATKNAVNTRWKLQAMFRNVRINGPAAIGAPGCLTGPELTPLIRSHMTTNGAPVEAADIFANSIGGAWEAWQDSVMIPGLPWYPAFAAWPGPQAPPTPNVPAPLLTLQSARQSELTSSQRLTARIFEQFQGTPIPPEIRVEIEGFSRMASRSFQIWFSSNQVLGVLGQGPVPTFAPPVVPTGSVVGGNVIPVPGIIHGSLLF